MVVNVRIEVDDTTRKAIRNSFGETGLANREDIVVMVQAIVDEHWRDLCDDAERECNQGQDTD